MIDKKISEALAQGKSTDDPEIKSLLLVKEMIEMKYPDSEEREEELKIYQAFEPMSTEERYNAAVKPLDLPFFGRLFCTDILDANRRMVQITYERYVLHAAEKDIVRAGIDAWAVEYAGNFLVTTGKLDFDTLDFLLYPQS